MKTLLASIGTICLALAVTTSAAGAGNTKFSPDLQPSASAANVEVIVQYKVVPTEAHHRRIRNLGGVVHGTMNHVKAGHYTVPAAALESLSEDPDVVYISPNRPVRGALNITAATVHSDVANAQGYTGSGIGVAVIDSGMSDMPEFHNGQSRIVYQQSFVPNLPNLNMNCPGGGAQAGTWFSSSLNVQGGLAPYSLAVTAGGLPAGLSLNATTGNVTGIPTTATSGPPLQFTVSVIDSMGNSVSQSCNLNVNQAQNGQPHQLQVNCPGGGTQANAWYDSVLSAQGGYPPYQFSISSGGLPAGLTLDPVAGAVTGTPTTATNGGLNFGVTMSDRTGSSVSQSCSMNVGQAQQVQMSGTVDQYGHGSHVAGIIGSNGSGSVYIGIAPAANIVSLRVLDQNGNGTDANVIAAIDTAISLAKTYNIRVINLSLGRPVFEPAALDPLCQAVEQAWKAGIVVVVAAGNEGRNNAAGTSGYGTITAPGNDPCVITVGAMKTEGTTTRTDDNIASYSSKGPTAFDHYAKPDIVAPGNLVVSTMQSGQSLSQEYSTSNRINGDFFILSGTSMATPVVSGAAALLIQKNPLLTPDQVKARLMRNATKTFPLSSIAVDPTTGISYTSYYDIFTVGAGYIDVAAALADTTVATGTALSPAAAYNTLTGIVTLQNIGAVNVVWGSNVVWGANVVWGSSVVLGTHVVWGTNVVWGSSTTQGFNVVWGAHVVWGTSETDSSEATAVAINGEP